MAPMTSFPPGSAPSEYLLVIPLPERLEHRIVKVKRDLAATHTGLPARGSRSHIPLLKFAAGSGLEEKIVQRLQLIAMGTPPFGLELKNYGSFPEHTLFIALSDKAPVQRLVKDLRQLQPLLKAAPALAAGFFTDPHIVVATGLKPAQFASAWKQYERARFSGRFVADCMLLLKRAAGDRAYLVEKRLEFMNAPVTMKQGNLFGD